MGGLKRCTLPRGHSVLVTTAFGWIYVILMASGVGFHEWLFIKEQAWLLSIFWFVSHFVIAMATSAIES